jgi:hypothetical protein
VARLLGNKHPRYNSSRGINPNWEAESMWGRRRGGKTASSGGGHAPSGRASKRRAGTKGPKGWSAALCESRRETTSWRCTTELFADCRSEHLAWSSVKDRKGSTATTLAAAGEDHGQRNGAMRFSNSIGANRETFPPRTPHRSGLLSCGNLANPDDDKPTYQNLATNATFLRG